MEKYPKKILLSGVQPSGRAHIGNYFVAMRQNVDFQDEYETLLMIADYHALTTVHDPEVLRENIVDLAIDYLAIGLDIEKAPLFQQSDIPEHTEATWIFNCITTMPYLMRAHAFKDAEQKSKEVNIGLFDYPMLMAADILLHDAQVVPVGADQKQHIEYARDTAEKFNHLFGKIFKLPEAFIKNEVSVVPGLDGRKMGKSYKNTIPLFAEDDELEQLAMSIVTDSKGVNDPKDPDSCNVFALHRLFADKGELAELDSRYRAGEIGYKESKELLFERLKRFIAPLREKRREIESDKKRVLEILKDGGERARERAARKMREVKRAVGVLL